MYRMLIADDEPKIRKRIAALLDWPKLGIEVAGMAEDGRQALEMIANSSFDLCVIDISMPRMNGIDLIEGIRKTSPNMLCIIVSGYDEFTYAQHSIRLNVFDYLLKPLNAAALQKTMESAVETLDARKQAALSLEKTLALVRKHIVPLRQSFLRELIYGVLSEEEICDHAETLGLHDDGNYGILFIAVDPLLTSSFPQEYASLQPLNLVARDELLSDMGEEVVAVFDKFENLIILTLNGGDEETLSCAVKRSEEIMCALGRKIAAVEAKTVLRLSRTNSLYTDWIERREHMKTPILWEIARYVDLHYDEPDLSLSRLAEEFHVSSGYIGRAFRQLTGKTFIDYLIHVRIRSALRLLDRTDLKIYEIAEKTGYSTQHYFCTAFKQVLGVSPSDYRANFSASPITTENDNNQDSSSTS